MFIVSKRNYQVRRADGSPYLIRKDFVGEIPEDVAGSNLVQRAIRGGMIFVPEGSRDKQLEEAEAEAAEKAAGNDIRPDAEQAEEKKDAEKGKKADGSNRGTPKSGGGT